MIQFRSELLDRLASAAGGVMRDKIYHVCMKPNGGIEGEGENTGEQRFESGGRWGAGKALENFQFLR